MEQGDKIVLRLDVNDDVRCNDYSRMLEEIGKKEVILKFHKDKSHPATQNRNTTQS